MDKKKLNRHDLVYLTKEGKERIKTEFANCQSDKEKQTAEIFAENSSIPGIVRRNETGNDEVLPLGFGHNELFDEMRIRFSTEISWREAQVIIRPYEITSIDFKARNKSLKLARTVLALAKAQQISIGLVGSVALEIVTGLPYTNDDSDLDLLVKGLSITKIELLYNSLKELSGTYHVDLDLEVELKSGYGVKAAELFQNTGTLLGKSLKDVQILNKKEVLEELSMEE